MKQMSLFDSFMRKPKPADENRKTNEKEKTPEVKTADRIEHKQEKVQVHFERKVSSFDEEEDKPKNDFKDLINSGDFAFGAVAEGSKKKRKMEIEDDEDLPRISAQKMEEEPAYEENFNESSGSGDKPARRRGRAASSAKGKKAPE